MRTLIKIMLVAAALMPSLAMAYEGRWRRGPRYYHGYPIVMWHGHYGYWVGGVWYPYVEPVYPAPVYPVAPAPSVGVGVRVGPVGVAVTEPIAPAPQPAMVAPPVASAPPPTAAMNNPSPTPPGPKISYYCDSSAAYYPNVQTCSSGWRAMAAP